MMTSPFARFIAPEPAAEATELHPLRARVRASCRLPEPTAVSALREEGRLPTALAAPTRALAGRLATHVRTPAPALSGQARQSGLVQNLLQE